MEIFKHCCMNVVWARGSIFEVLVEGRKEFGLGYWVVVRREKRVGIKVGLGGFVLDFYAKEGGIVVGDR